MNTHIEIDFQHLVAAWQRATPIKGVDSSLARLVRCQHVIRWSDFENRQSPYGWTVMATDLGACLNMPVQLIPVHIHTNDNGANDD